MPKSRKSSDPFASRESEKYENPVPSREFILEHLEDLGAPASFSKLCKQLELNEEERIEGLRRRLIAMSRDGQIISNRKVIADLETAVKKLTPGLAEGEAIIEKLKQKADQSSETLISVQVERDTFQQAVQELRIELLNLENKRDNLNFKKRVAKETIIELEERKISIASEKYELESKRKSLKTHIFL